MKRAEIIEAAKAFIQDKKVDSVFATSDGQLFFESGLNAAINHARSLGKSVIHISADDEQTKAWSNDPQHLDYCKLKFISKMSNEDIEKRLGNDKVGIQPKDTTKLNAAERAARIKSAATVEEVNELLKGETAKTVKSAGASRVKELEAQAQAAAARTERLKAIETETDKGALEAQLDDEEDTDIIKALETRIEELEAAEEEE